MSALTDNYARQPVEFVRGEGLRLWDADGAEYLDFLAGISVCNVGHCHPRVVEAVRAQAGTLMHVSNLFFTRPMAALAERLTARSIGGRVYFANSGAEANEAALKVVRKARPRGEIVVVHGGFHGRTYGALSATPQESKQAPFAPLVPGFVPVPPDPDAIAGAVHAGTAAVLLEVIQGESGVIVLPEEVLRAARAACDATGAFLVLDEVQTGMGRTGTLWAYEQTGVVPDAITVAKALGGGLPIGALVCGERLAGVFAPGDHGSTFAGGPVVAAAALAAFDILDDPELLARVRELGERLRESLRELPGVLDVRGRGLMVAADVDADAPGVARRALLEQRLVINATGPGTLRFLPPLVLDESHVDDAVERVAAVLPSRSPDRAVRPVSGGGGARPESGPGRQARVRRRRPQLAPLTRVTVPLRASTDHSAPRVADGERRRVAAEVHAVGDAAAARIHPHHVGLGRVQHEHRLGRHGERGRRAADLDLGLRPARALRHPAERAVAAVGHPDRAEPDRDVLRIAPDGDAPPGHEILALVDARQRAVTGVDDPDVVRADGQGGREPPGADRRPDDAVGDGVDARHGPARAVGHPDGVGPDGDVDRVAVHRDPAPLGARTEDGVEAR